MVDAWQRHRFFEGLARALLAVGRPMLLVLDNMQWCDQETLAFLTFCLGLSASAQILVAGTLRDDNLNDDPELAGWTVRMRATGLLTELSLSPLEFADTARLAAAICGRPLQEADTSLLQATTGGFPLYVIEAVRSSVDLGSPALPAGDLTAVLRDRLEQATAAAREVTGLAAAVGTNFTLDLLTEASDLDADTVVGAVDELWRRRILHEFGDGYDFSHDLLRETAYVQVSPPKRWLLHRRIAKTLELLHANNMDVVSAQLAEQYARGGRPGRAVAYYRRAADAQQACLPMPRRSGCTRRRCRSSAACPRGKTGTAKSSQSWKPWRRRSPPDSATRPGAPTDARTLGRPGGITWAPGLEAHRPGRAVCVAVRPGPHCRRVPDGQPRTDASRPGI